MAEFVLTDGLKKLIGTAEPPLLYKVEEGAIQRYARAVGDSQPHAQRCGVRSAERIRQA